MLHYEPHSDQQGPCTKPLLSPLTQPQSRNPTPMMHQVRLRTKEGGTRRAVSGNSGASVLEAWDPLAVPFVGMCVCTYVYIYIYTYTYMHARVHMHVRTYIHTDIHAHICTYLPGLKFGQRKLAETSSCRLRGGPAAGNSADPPS